MAEPSEIMRLSFLPAMPGDSDTRVDSIAMLPGMPLDLPESPQDDQNTDVSVLDDILVGFSDLSADLENTLNDTK